MPKYRNVGRHAEEVHIGDKRVMLGPGEFANLKADDEKNDHNKELTTRGVLKAVEEGK